MLYPSNLVSLEPFDDRFSGGGRVLARLAKQLEQALDEVGLSLPQYRLLGWLEHGDHASARLAERLAVTPPSITALVDGLVGRGLVERRPDPADRRRLPLHLTATGHAALADADRAVEGRLADLLTHVDPAAGAEAAASLSVWHDALDRARDAKHDATHDATPIPVTAVR